ncbi:MAG: hypothetical protein F6K19_50065 [Cyanothece sp. SIO1E1]|nr:hypothetical protein [Cyanothece sp. SIO1E1]
MGLFLELGTLCLLAGAIVASVRFLVVPGIDDLSHRLKLSIKARGQLLGYATSTPELVIIVVSAASGVFDAGFWNIASSNIINWILFMTAVLYWKQLKELWHRPFSDELMVGMASVLIPLILFATDAQGSLPLGIALIGLFVIYKWLDRKWNPVASTPSDAADDYRGGPLKVIGLVAGIAVIILAGWKLGQVAEELIIHLGISSWIIGWILGFVSSIPEMSGFFEVYRKHHQNSKLHGLEDSQEALDSLVASNMSNLCLILPLGILVLTFT